MFRMERRSLPDEKQHKKPESQEFSTSVQQSVTQNELCHSRHQPKVPRISAQNLLGVMEFKEPGCSLREMLNVHQKSRMRHFGV